MPLVPGAEVSASAFGRPPPPRTHEGFGAVELREQRTVLWLRAIEQRPGFAQQLEILGCVPEVDGLMEMMRAVLDVFEETLGQRASEPLIAREALDAFPEEAVRRLVRGGQLHQMMLNQPEVRLGAGGALVAERFIQGGDQDPLPPGVAEGRARARSHATPGGPGLLRKGFGGACSSGELLQQLPGFPEVDRVHALLEPGVDPHQDPPGRLRLSRVPQQPAQTHRRPQFEEEGALLASDGDGAEEIISCCALPPHGAQQLSALAT